jgi:uncharacterized protein YqeY
MSLVQQLTDDMKAAMKSGDHARLETVRFALAGLKAAEKEKQAKDPSAVLTDEEAVATLQKEAKRRKESIELFKKGDRTDLAEKEEADLAVIQAYLPKELSREEIAAIVDKVRAADPSIAGDFSGLMREAMKEVKGRADGRLVGEVIKEKIGA